MLRNLITFIVSLFLLTACSTTSNNQLDDKTLSNEDTVSKSVEEETNLDISTETNSGTDANAKTGDEPLYDAGGNDDSNVLPNSKANLEPNTTLDVNTSSDSNEDSNTYAKTELTSTETPQITAKHAADEHDSEKGIGNYFLQNNEPTKKVIKSLEGVTDTLNILTFGIFATGHG